MKTLTPEDFKKKYGEAGVNSFTQDKPKEGYLSRVSSTLKNNLSEALQSEKSSAKGEINPFSAGANIAKNVTGAVLSPLTEAPGLKQVGQGFSAAGNAIVNTGLGNRVTSSLAKNFSPTTLGTVSNIAETGLNVAGIEGAVEGVRGGIKTAKNISGKIADTTKDTYQTVKNKVSTPAKSPLEAAIKDSTPDYESLNPTKKGKYLDRVQEGGVLEGRSIKPNKLEIEAGTELSKVPGYDPNGTKLSKYQATKNEVVKRAQQLKSDVASEKTIVPKRELSSKVVSAINDVPNHSLLLQTSDPVIQSYVRVLKNALVKEPGNLSGVLQLRKVLDDAYENARGKQAFGSDKISALDDIHTAARNTLTEYLVDKAKNVDVKGSLRSQWNLYRALDELRTAAEREKGSSVGRLQQNHPVISKAARVVGRSIGVGAGVDLLH